MATVTVIATATVRVKKRAKNKEKLKKYTKREEIAVSSLFLCTKYGVILVPIYNFA